MYKNKFFFNYEKIHKTFNEYRLIKMHNIVIRNSKSNFYTSKTNNCDNRFLIWHDYYKNEKLDHNLNKVSERKGCHLVKLNFNQT